MALIPKLRRRPARAGEMTIVEHLEELRRRLILSLGGIGVGAIGGWLLYERVLDLMRSPYCRAITRLPEERQPPTGCDFVFASPTEGIIIRLKVVFYLGLLLALPIVLYQLWRFITPGLYPKERRLAIPFVLVSVSLFAAGAWFALQLLPRGLNFLLSFPGEGLVPLLTADRYLGFVILVTLAFGIAFEFPVILVFLGMVGVLSSVRLRSWRRYTILFIAVFAAVLTPTQDPWTMLALMSAMYLFYELAILILRVLKR
jgi:sec-independent protein translocase protein TatC